MRRYIRHPHRMPIDFQIDHTAPKSALGCKLRTGCGLCFHADAPIAVGSRIHVRIPLSMASGQVVGGPSLPGSAFEADGRVAWCRAEGSGYSVAVNFEEDINTYVLRMVEQICHIENYREQMRSAEGRILSEDEAAREWIAQYAAAFPS